MDRKRFVTILIVVVALLAIPATVFLVGQRQDIRKRAAGAGDGKLVCDSGTDPYNSDTITVTNNYNETIDLSSYVFRCTYKPNRIKKGYYYCDSNCNPSENPDCDVGVWDSSASVDFALQPGESRTLTMTVNPCEIAQLDVQNPEDHALADNSECYNVRSQYTNPLPPDWWPGGIAFGIKDNPTGYDAATGTCPQPTATPRPPTPTPTRQPTAPPGQPSYTPVPTATRTPTPQPTAPPGQPTYTPIPTTPPQPATPTPVVYPTTPLTQPPVGQPPTAIPTQPVSGNVTYTIMGLVGGIALLVLSIL